MPLQRGDNASQSLDIHAGSDPHATAILPRDLDRGVGLGRGSG
jgi:hypothetical protein